MKKTLFLLMAILVPLFFVTSCGSDDDNETTVSIVGKIYNHKWKGILDSYSYYTYSVRFISNSEYEFAYKKEGEIISSRTSTYSLNYPKIQFKSFGTNSTDKDAIGIFIDENTFRVGNDEYTSQ